MEINKRTIMWIVFAVSLFVLWNDWMVANGGQSFFGSRATAPARLAQAPAAAPASAGAAAVPGPPAAPGDATAAAPPAAQREIITITTGVLKADNDTAGGIVRRVELL